MDNSATLTVCNLTQNANTNYWCLSIGNNDSQDQVYNLSLNGGNIYAATTQMDDCTAIGGGGNGVGEVTVSGAVVTAVSSSSGTAIGGGVYIGGGSFEMQGGTLQACTASSNGGGAYVSGGHCEMANGLISSNTAGSNGGGVYVLNTGVTFSGDTGIRITGNSAVDGGGLCINQTEAPAAGELHLTSVANGSINGNTASRHGGGLYHTGGHGKCVVSGRSQINGNSAVNGGGLYIISGSALEINGVHISENMATMPETITATTANDHAGNRGVGGGVYVGPGSSIASSFTISSTAKSAGIYSNTAKFAAADIYADIHATVLSLPKVNDMLLSDTVKATGWYADYATGDTDYAMGFLNNRVPTAAAVLRYDAAGLSGDTTAYLVEEDLSSLSGKYVCLTIGKQIIEYGSIVISKTVSGPEDPNQYFIFRVQATELNNVSLTKPVLEVAVKGGESVTIERVPFGSYTVTECSDWSWRYNCANGVLSAEVNSVTPVRLAFSNAFDSDTRWLDANSSNAYVNVYGK